MGDVRSVTVLFTDLVGSTSLASSVSPEHADDLRREHFSVLRRAIAAADGTEVKSLGDGLMVAFSTASSGLASAVGMQQATELDNRSREVPFGLRIGLSSGEVVEEDGDFFGDSVVEAARLCARCEAGQVLAADVVRALAGRRAAFECVPLGELELKGLPDPVPAVEVRWEPLTATVATDRVPLPTRLATAPAAGVVGRASELAMLAAAAKRVAAGDGREVVIVGGEAGLGKTTLVAEAARSAFAADACVLFGHAEEDLATPYGLFAEALRHLVTHISEAELRAHVAECGPELVRLVPALSRRLPHVKVPAAAGDPEGERYELFAAVTGLLARAAEQRPVVLVLDDLQWADTASLQLLRHIAAHDPALRLLVLGTYRDSDVTAGHALVDTMAALWRLDKMSRVDLRGLDDRGVVELLEATAGHGLDDAGLGLAHAVYRETDGNPFFATEVLRNLAETGAIYQDDSGRWVSDQDIEDLRLPDSVREVLGARIARLGPQATRVLSSAAVIGRDFDLELLARAADLHDDEILDLLEAAENVALVREVAVVAGRFTFAHALIQRTLYQDLGTSRRARMHQRIAEALEELTTGRSDERVGELAHHWAHAVGPTDTTKAVDYAGRAGDVALAALAPEEAVRWYGQAVELLDPADAHRRAELLLGLGTAQQQAGAPEYRETLLESARLAGTTDDPELLARAALANDRGFMSSVGSADTDQLAVIDRALETLGDRDPAARARLLAAAAGERIFVAPLAERRALAEAAIALMRTCGDPVALVDVALTASFSIVVPWTLDRRIEAIREAADVADEIGDPTWRWRAHQALRTVLLEAADRAGIDEETRVLEETWESVPNATLRWSHCFSEAMFAILDDRLEEAEQLAAEALEVGTAFGAADALAIYSAQLANLYESRGMFGQLASAVEVLVRDYPGLPAFRAAWAQSLAEAGDLDRCRQTFEADRDAGFPMTEDSTWSNAHKNWAQVAVALGDRAAGTVLHGRLAPHGDRIVTTGITVTLTIGHYVGRLEHLLGRLDEADASFAGAHARHERLRAPQFVARTEVRWAALLVERGRAGDHDRARAMADGARAAASERPGWEWIERDALEVLDRL